MWSIFLFTKVEAMRDNGVVARRGAGGSRPPVTIF